MGHKLKDTRGKGLEGIEGIHKAMQVNNLKEGDCSEQLRSTRTGNLRKRGNPKGEKEEEEEESVKRTCRV
jgi:hypothetical protein